MKTDYIDRETQVEPLIERVIDFDALEKINQAVLQAENDPLVSEDVKKIRVFESQAQEMSESEHAMDKRSVIDMAGLVEEQESSLIYHETRI